MSYLLATIPQKNNLLKFYKVILENKADPGQFILTRVTFLPLCVATLLLVVTSTFYSSYNIRGQIPINCLTFRLQFLKKKSYYYRVNN